MTLPFVIEGREVWLSISGVAFEDGVVYAFRNLTEERALDELKGEFVATVSHELRTPLAAIYGSAQTLLRQDIEIDEDKRRRLLQVIAQESERPRAWPRTSCREPDRPAAAPGDEPARHAPRQGSVEPCALNPAERQGESRLPLELDVAGDEDRCDGCHQPRRQRGQVFPDGASSKSASANGTSFRVRSRTRVRIHAERRRRIFGWFYPGRPQLSRSVGSTSALHLPRAVRRMDESLTVTSGRRNRPRRSPLAVAPTGRRSGRAARLISQTGFVGPRRSRRTKEPGTSPNPLVSRLADASGRRLDESQAENHSSRRSVKGEP
jgi:hypothetical protein